MLVVCWKRMISTARRSPNPNLNARFMYRLVNTISKGHLLGGPWRAQLYRCLLNTHSAPKQSIIFTKLWCNPVRSFLMATFLRQHISTGVSIRHCSLQKQAERKLCFRNPRARERYGPPCARFCNSIKGDSLYLEKDGKIDTRLQKMMK